MRNRNAHFTTDKLNAGEALNRAHFLALAPYAFEAARIMRDRGILAQLDESSAAGNTAEDIAANARLPINSAIALLEAGLGIGIISGDEDRYYLTMAGQYFLLNPTIRTNTDFMRDVCLPGMPALEHSLNEGAPLGLKAFGDWTNVFEALPHFPESARNSWYGFNNHHSDAAFRDALPILFAQNPARLLDLGGSTGRFALACMDYSEAVHIGMADLAGTLAHAEPGVAAAVRAGRISLHPQDILDTQSLPAGYDTIWMSQFMPCFSEKQIGIILQKCRAALPDNGTLWMLETFWDRQRHEAAATALQITSLYFLNIATGVSRMWRSDNLLQLVAEAGFYVTAQHDGLGRGHTLLELRKSE